MYWNFLLNKKFTDIVRTIKNEKVVKDLFRCVYNNVYECSF